MYSFCEYFIVLYQYVIEFLTNFPLAKHDIIRDKSLGIEEFIFTGDIILKKLESLEKIKEDAETVYNELLSGQKFEFKSVKDDTFNDFRLSKKGQTGIYAVICNGEIKYVGKTKNASDRLRDHFIKPGEGTASKIDEINNMIKNGNKVEVSFVEVPISIYSSIEESIIETHKKQLSLNKRAS